MSVTEFVEEAFVNEFGQKIEVGEEIIFVGTRRKSTYIARGIFRGVRYADVTTHSYMVDETGNYIKEDFTDHWGKTRSFYKMQTETCRKVVSVVVRANRGKKYQWITKDDGTKSYVKSDEDVFSTSTLPLKRIYKLVTSLSELSGKSF